MTEECESNISNQSSSILNRKIMPQKRKKSLIAPTWLWVLCPIATTECDKADGNEPEWPNTDPTSTTFMSGPSKLSTMHMLKCQELSVIAFCIPVWEFTTVATTDTVISVSLYGCLQLWLPLTPSSLYPCMGVHNYDYHWHHHLCIPVWVSTTMTTTDTIIYVPLYGCLQLWLPLT